MAGGFKDTARYLRGLSRKERSDEERKHRLLDEADFRDKLAKIIPGFPAGYKLPHATCDRLRFRAEECRTMADAFRDPECKRRLINLADQYERMAIAAE